MGNQECYISIGLGPLTIMRKLNIMHVAVNSSIKWQRIEEIRFTQFGYCLTISYGRMAKMPSYLFDTTIQDGIGYICFWPFYAVWDLCCVRKEVPRHTFGGSLLD